MSTVKKVAKYLAALAICDLCVACATGSQVEVRNSKLRGEFVVLDTSDPECVQIRERTTTAHPITSKGRVIYGWIANINPGEKIVLTRGSSTEISEWSRYQFHRYSYVSSDLNADGSFIVYLEDETVSLLNIEPSDHRVVTILMTTRELCVGIPLQR
jgi:hypothetical protein